MDALLQTDTTTAAAATASVSASTPPPDSVVPPVSKQLHQESSIFSYINNLSPIRPVKAAHVAGYPGLGFSPGTISSPPVNLHPEANFPESSESNKLHSEDLLELEVCKEKSKICSNESGSRDWQNSNSLIDCEEDPSNNPSGRSHEYSTDTVKVDNENLTPTAGSSLVQSHHTPQSWSDYTGLEETNPQLGGKSKSTEDPNNAVGASEVVPALLNHSIQEQLSLDKMRVETDVVQGLNEMPYDVCQKVETSSLVDHSSTEQYCGFSVDQEVAQKDELDIGNQSLHKPLLSSQGCQDNVLTVQTSKLLVEGAVFKGVKGQYHRGLHKRCLQFDDAHQSFKARTGSSSLSDIIATSQLPISPAGLDGYNSYGPEVSNASCRRQLDNLTQPVTSLVSRRNSGSSRSTVSKPLGIGLHLNSIISAMPIGSGVGGTVMSLEKGSVILPGGNLATVMGSFQPENSHASVSFTDRDTRSASSKDGSNQTQPLVTEGSFASQPTSCGKRKYISGDAVVVKEFNQSSPKKKKKKTSTTSNGDGCKRCNCKKTKCLKLYCDCFAAGIYCADTCACQGCFNRPEYEDTVLETRQQIESRNPLAFLPKILRPLTESPAESNMDSGNSATPSSGRHKRGCNCKKSMCLKKYCECYQANVGCSSACRCDGCKNVYGMKEESDKDALSQEHEIYQPASTEVPEWVGRQDGLVQTELCDHQNFTPQTPAFQFTDRVNRVSRPRFSSGGFSSPEADFQFLQKSPDSTRVADNYDMMTTNAYTDTQGIGYITDEHTQLNGSSSLRAFDYSSLSSKVAERKTTSSRSQLFPASINSFAYQHCSPITPVTQFGGSKLVSRLEFGEKQHEILEDDTPEILKDSCNPMNAVKSTSPNKKRVSPPQGHNRLGSSSSVSLKSGRKFILRAVQSFPPLTPCIDSKSSRSLSKIETKSAGARNDDQ